MPAFPEKFKLFEECKIIPYLDHGFHYEIFDMNPNIGFKVENSCFILFPNKLLKIVSKDELTKYSVSSMCSNGHILFKKAFQVLDKCSNNDTITVLHCLVPEIQQYQGIGIYLYLFWIYHTLSLLSTSRDTISSFYIRMSKKIPKNKEFFEVINKKV